MWLVVCVLLIPSGISARDFTDEEISQFPPLFHLDNYKRCLTQKDGLYCLGTFHITPAKHPHPNYELIKEYSETPFKYNRTLVHRGYCVSARCPSSERNSSLRFEHCAAQWGQKYALRTTLHSLDYCRTHTDTTKDDIPTTSQTIFIKVIYLLLFLNIVGTLYDVMSGDKQHKNKLLASWSIPSNWWRLTAVYADGDPRLSALTPLQGFRVVALLVIMFCHTNIQQLRLYSANPEIIEIKSDGTYGSLLSNGSSLVHVFEAISIFLTTYNLLLLSEKRPLSLHMLPLCIVKRVIRMSPVYLLLIGYAATWWPYARDGPLVPTVIGKESKICENKFWAHAFYVNNIVDKEDICVAPTWFLAVDMHLYILSCFLTLSGWLRKRALTVYPALVIASAILNTCISYIHNYKSMVHFTTPENFRQYFQDLPSYTNFYNATWAALPSCFIGLSMAHLHYELQKKKFNGADHKWLVVLTNLAVPLTLCWGLMGIYVRGITSRLFNAAYIGVDRFVYVLIDIIMLFGVINTEGPLRRFFGWTGWHVMGRMSLSVMLGHWFVNLIIASRPNLYSYSLLDNAIDWLATCVITYILAIPLTVLVEIPMQRFLNVLIF